MRAFAFFLIPLLAQTLAACDGAEPFVHEVTFGGVGPGVPFEIRVSGTGEQLSSNEAFTVSREYARYETDRAYVIVLEEWRDGAPQGSHEFRAGICSWYCGDTGQCDPDRVALESHGIGTSTGTIVTHRIDCLVDGLSFSSVW